MNRSCSKCGLGIIIILFTLSCSNKLPPQEFPILAWYGPDKTLSSLASFQQMHKAGFSICYSPYTDRDFNLKALDWGDSAHIKLLLADKRINAVDVNHDSTFALLDSIINDYSGHPAFWGYFLKDEPGKKEFQKLARLNEYLSKKDSLHQVYINLFPIYTTPVRLDTNDYAGYVQDFLETVHPRIASFDHYPILDSGLRPRFFENLEIIRRAALKDTVPFWAFALTTRHGQYVKPVLPHLRFEVYSALAYGAKGIQYFTYATPRSNRKFKFGEALLDPSGQTTTTYHLVAKLNNEIRTIGPLLLDLTSTGVYHSDPVPQNCRPLVLHLPISKIEGQSILAGFFQGKKNEKYVFLVNKNYNTGALPGIYFSQKINKIVEVSKNHDKPLIVKWENSDSLKKCDILFKAGEGRLFRIYGQSL
ncbi:MAG: hypothetical protein GXO75_03985 [Calditrichaeota bacterium]|nr:hypothetical protein [Calditrichota bacterium]